MTKALTTKPIDKLKALINQESVQAQFKNAMGKHSDAFVASLIDVFNDGLQDCEPSAVIQEALKAAVLKLPISKGLGFAYVVPYNESYQVSGQWKKKKVPNFQIGYKGMIQLAMRSGQMKILNADAVYEGELAGVNRLTGIFELNGQKQSSKIIGYFVYMELINGFQKAEYWPSEQILEHAEKFSKSYQADLKYKKKKSTWSTDFDAMAKKTVLRSVLSKYAPMSIEFMTAMTYDNEEAIEREEKNITEEAEDLSTKPKTPPPPPASDKTNNSKKSNSSSGDQEENLDPPLIEPKPEPELSSFVAHLKKLKDSEAYQAPIRECIDTDMFTMDQLNHAIDHNKEDEAAAIVKAIESVID